MESIVGRCLRRKRPAPPFVFLAFLVFCLHPSPQKTHAETTSEYISQLIERSRQQELHEHDYWHTLLHYRVGVLGLRSLVDDPDFFLSERGKVDPQAELEATIRAFFRDVGEASEHPVCKFVARFSWLAEMLHIDKTRLPLAECGRIKEFMAQIKPKSASLIFPASYMSNPASMFGHTLLTIDTSEESKLLSYAINYSAVTEETFGPTFAIKGLFGLYDGYYSMLPYYEKLQEYSDVNHRDIWEYSLNLNEEEVKRLLLHASEMDFIASDYYFFDENCSYNLLFLLDAGRPGLNLANRAGWWVTPLDTIILTRDAGLVEDVVYRPSKTSKIKHLVSRLSEDGQERALSVAKGRLEAGAILKQDFSEAEKALILDTASEYVQYMYTKGQLTKELYVKRFRAVLSARSLIATEGNPHVVPTPTRPDKGHGQTRLSFGLGLQDDTGFQEIRFRPAYHGFLDSSEGYLDNSKIVFGQAVVRHYSTDGATKLEALDVIELGSFVPRDRFFKPFSWRVYTGLQRRMLEDGNNHLLYRLNPAFGVSYRLGALGLFYILSDADFNVSGALEDNYAIGVGGTSGIMGEITGNWKIHGFGTYRHYGFEEKNDFWEGTIRQSYILSKNTSLEADYTRTKSHDFYETEATLYLNIYF